MIVRRLAIIMGIPSDAGLCVTAISQDRRRLPRMHTLCPPASVFCSIFKSRLSESADWGSRTEAAVLSIVAALLMLAGPTYAQVEFPGAPDDRGVNVRVYPADFWGPRAGFGAGAGLVVHHLARSGDQGLVTAAPAQHEQTGTVSYASANPYRARRYVLVDARALHTDREWIGPWTFRRTAVRSRLRVGHTFLEQRLLVQPHLTLLSSTVADVGLRDGRSPAASSPQEADRTGVRTGLDLRLDTRGSRFRTSRGLLLQGTWDRYVPVDGGSLRFDQVDLDAHGFWPLAPPHRLVLRLGATITQSRSSAPVPLYMRPTLSGSVVPGWPRGHAVGADRLLGTLLYRFPLFQIAEISLLEGHVGTHLAAVYSSLGDQFSPSIRFDDKQNGRASRPLRPSASVGLRFLVPFRERSFVDLAVGVSPEGISAARVRFTRPLQSLRRPHHTADPIR